MQRCWWSEHTETRLQTQQRIQEWTPQQIAPRTRVCLLMWLDPKSLLTALVWRSKSNPPVLWNYTPLCWRRIGCLITRKCHCCWTPRRFMGYARRTWMCPTRVMKTWTDWSAKWSRPWRRVFDLRVRWTKNRTDYPTKKNLTKKQSMLFWIVGLQLWAPPKNPTKIRRILRRIHFRFWSPQAAICLGTWLCWWPRWSWGGGFWKLRSFKSA